MHVWKAEFLKAKLDYLMNIAKDLSEVEYYWVQSIRMKSASLGVKPKTSVV